MEVAIEFPTLQYPGNVFTSPPVMLLLFILLMG